MTVIMSNSEKILGLNYSEAPNTPKPNIVHRVQEWAREGIKNKTLLFHPDLTNYVNALVNNNPGLIHLARYLTSPLPEARKEAMKMVLRAYGEFVSILRSSGRRMPVLLKMTPILFITAFCTACGQPAPTGNAFEQGRLYGQLESNMSVGFAEFQKNAQDLKDQQEELKKQMALLGSATGNMKTDLETKFQQMFLGLQAQLQQMVDEGKLTKEQQDKLLSQITILQGALASKVDAAALEPIQATLGQVATSYQGVQQQVTELKTALEKTPTSLPDSGNEQQDSDTESQVETIKPLFQEIQLLPLQPDVFEQYQDTAKLTLVNMNKEQMTVMNATFVTTFQNQLSGPAAIVIDDQEYPVHLTDGMFPLPKEIVLPGETKLSMTIRYKFKEGANIPTDQTYKGQIVGLKEMETRDINGNVNIIKE